MNNLDNPNICMMPWTTAYFNRASIQLCCNAPSKYQYCFQYMKGPWEDPLIDWWNMPVFIELRERMLTEGACNVCSVYCEHNLTKQTPREKLAILKQLKPSFNLELIEQSIEQGGTRLVSKPTAFVLHTGTVCNSNCLFCPQNYLCEIGKEPRVRLSIEEIRNSLDRASEAVTIHLLGGDLFCLSDKDLAGYWQTLRDRDIKGYTTTNGIGLTLERYKLFVHNYFQSVTLSLTTMDRTDYKDYYQVDKLPLVIKNVTDAVKEFKETRYNVINCCLFGFNYDNLHDLVRFAGDNGFILLNMFPPNRYALERRGLIDIDITGPGFYQDTFKRWEDAFQEYEEIAKDYPKLTLRGEDRFAADLRKAQTKYLDN